MANPFLPWAHFHLFPRSRPRTSIFYLPPCVPTSPRLSEPRPIMHPAVQSRGQRRRRCAARVRSSWQARLSTWRIVPRYPIVPVEFRKPASIPSPALPHLSIRPVQAGDSFGRLEARGMAWIILHIVVECNGRRYVCVFGNLLSGHGRPGSRYHFDVWRYIGQLDHWEMSRPRQRTLLHRRCGCLYCLLKIIIPPIFDAA